MTFPVKGPLNAVAAIVPVKALADLSHTTFELAPVNVTSPSTVNELRDPKVTIEELTTLEARVVPVKSPAAVFVASFTQPKFPLPSVFNICPVLQSVAGRVNVKLLAIVAGACRPTQLLESLSANLKSF